MRSIIILILIITQSLQLFSQKQYILINSSNSDSLLSLDSFIEMDAVQEIDKKNKVHWLWKWFLIAAIVSLLAEILILKFFKV